MKRIMKFKKESSIGATKLSDIKDNISTPKVITVNMETGTVYHETNEKFNKKEHFNNNNINNTEESSTRQLQIEKSENGICGFHLTRTKWDPYPWVSVVDADTPAETSGLKVGDCVIEVNGENVLGLRITDIAKLVRAKSEHVTLLLWSAGCETKCDPESLCDGPMPRTLQRLSIIVQSILSIIECPVCLDTIPPPAMQCQNGHLLCVNCRIRAEKCPVCRDRYTPRRALIAEQIYAAITTAFNLCRTEDKLRQKLFGTNVMYMEQKQQQHIYKQQQKTSEQHQSIVNMAITSMDKEEHPKALENTMKSRCRSGAEVCKSALKAQSNGKERIGLQLLPTNKFLTKLLLSKPCSMDNLSSATTTTRTTTQTQSTNSDGLALSLPTSPSTLNINSSGTNSPLPVLSATSDIACSTTSVPSDMTTQQIQSSSNQLHTITASTATPNVKDCTIFVPDIKGINCNGHLDDRLESRTTIGVKNKITKANGMSKHFSLSTNDLLVEKTPSEVSSSHLATPVPDCSIIVTRVKPQCTLNPEGLLSTASANVQTIEFATRSLNMLDKRPMPMLSQQRTKIGNSSHCRHKNSDESSDSAPSSDDDISLPSSSQIALSTRMKAPLDHPFCDLHILSRTSSDAGSSMDDSLSTSTLLRAEASASTSTS